MKSKHPYLCLVLSLLGGILPFNTQASLYTESLTKQLNECRAEYKAMAQNFQKNIDKEILKGTSAQTLKSQSVASYQELLNNKASECKQIKKDLEDAPTYEKQILDAPSGKKVGPVLRCFQLGQNKAEVLQCGKRLGFHESHYVPELGLWMLTPNKKAEDFPDHPLRVFLKDQFENKVLVILSSNNFTVTRIEIFGTHFWGTNQFNKTFLQAMQKNYGFTLLPQVQYLTETDVMTWYGHEDDGWNIEVFPEGYPSRVRLYRTIHSSNLKF